jgi:hypothetical protein
MCEASTPTCGVDAFGPSSPNMIIGLAHRSWTSPMRGYCWGWAKGLGDMTQSGHNRVKSRALLGCPWHEYKPHKAMATNEGTLEGPSSMMLPMTFNMYEFLFFRWSMLRPGRETKDWRSWWSMGNHGAKQTIARRPVQSWLHVVVAHWRIPKVVPQCNSLVCPLDYVLSQSGRWLIVFKTF